MSMIRALLILPCLVIIVVLQPAVSAFTPPLVSPQSQPSSIRSTNSRPDTATNTAPTYGRGKRNCPKGIRVRRNSQSTSSLWATSSRELRKREEGEKKARMEQRLKATTKRKLTASSSSSSSSPSSQKQEAKIKEKTVQVKKTTTTKATATPESTAAAAATKRSLPKTKAALTLRLQRATAKAKAAAIEADYANQRQHILEEESAARGRPFISRVKKFTNVTTTTSPNNIGTLTQLTRVVDKELRAASDGTARFHHIQGTTHPPPGITRDSMRSLLEENDAQWEKSQRQQNRTGTTGSVIQHIAVVISKPLVQDQITLEYACRVRALAKAMTGNAIRSDILQSDLNMSLGSHADSDDEDTLEATPYRPSIICFLGGTSSGNLLADADAGYLYFHHLCAANQISLEGVDFLLEKTTLGKGALKRVMRHLRQEYIPEWWKELSSAPADDEAPEEVAVGRGRMHTTSSPPPRLKKLQVHFAFFSCDYDLCRLNDIHYRSPRQSVLRHLVEEQELSSSAGQEEVVQPTWSYRFSTYPYVHSKDTVTAYLGKCYLLAEELTPVLVNIRGVVDGLEFFQRDNYRVLVSIRRSFVKDMEHFYQTQPSLKSTLRQYVSNSDYPLDVVLEGALLSLGRCVDLVRPAGLLIGYVPKDDWKTAEIVLQHAVSQLRDACDPDHPLDPADWGKLDHHYDRPKDNDGFPVDASGEDLAAITHRRIDDYDDKEEMGP